MRLAPLTVLFGTNSSGKTSLLQWLLLLKQTADSADRSQSLHLGDARSLVDLGTFSDILYRHSTENILKWELSWRKRSPITISDLIFESSEKLSGTDIKYNAEFSVESLKGGESGRLKTSKVSYSFADHSFSLQPKNQDGYELSSDNYTFKRSLGRAWSLPSPVKCYGFPDQVRAYYQNASFLSDFELEFENLFSGVFYLGPLRDYPQRQYPWGGSKPGNIGVRGERVVDAILSARDDGAYISPGYKKRRLTLEERIAKWLQELGLVSSFEVKAVAEGSKLYQVWVKRDRESTEVLLTDVGFGVSQILPVITLCYYVPEGSTIIFEQPEIHLHPLVQSGLADVFIDAMKNRRVQIIIESHSEHMLRRLQRRIAEEELLAHDAAMYFCSMKKGRSQLDELNLDIFGNITNWPKEFFGNEFGEMAAMTKASLKRKISKGV